MDAGRRENGSSHRKRRTSGYAQVTALLTRVGLEPAQELEGRLATNLLPDVLDCRELSVMGRSV